MPFTKNPHPGKFEGNKSQLVASILYGMDPDDEFGDCCDYEIWEGKIVGKRYTFYVMKDSQGFFCYSFSRNGSQEQKCKDRMFDLDKQDYEDWLDTIDRELMYDN